MKELKKARPARKSQKTAPDFKREIAALKREIADLKNQIAIRDVALNSTKILIHITDLSGIVQYVNSAHHTLLGYSETDRIGRSTFEVIHPEDLPRVLKLYQRILADPDMAESASMEYRILHKNGQCLWARAEGKFVKKKGKPVWAVLTVWDITERKRMEDRLHALAQRLQSIREEERTRISREIHDEFGQAMTSLKFDLALLAKSIPPKKADALEKSKRMMLYIDDTIKLIRKISTELRPPILDDFGLRAAIEWQAEDFEEKTGIRCELITDLRDEFPVDKDKAISFFRIFQESLTNVARHASATKVVVKFHETEHELTMHIQDNGRGITDRQIHDKTSLGITGMKERALSLGGEIEIKPAGRKGTLVLFRLPLPQPCLQKFPLWGALEL